jgi:hypothetical protein
MGKREDRKGVRGRKGEREGLSPLQTCGVLRVQIE